MKRIYICLVFGILIWSVNVSFSQAQPVKLASWNLLNYPDLFNQTGDTTQRHPYYRTVVQYVNPDILVTGENTSLNSPLWFLNNVMNANGNQYSKGTFILGPDTDNEIYYRTSMFTFVSNIPIQTDLRNISEFTLVYIASGDTLRIYAVHLKASTGSANEAKRALEVDSLRKVTNQLAAGKNFVVCGDFNIYGSYESAYQKLLQNNPNDDGHFIDPLTMSGTWDSALYRSAHTQSTRTTSFGGGASGGLDDRFDMILYSTAISQGSSGISFVTGSTTPVGNDGNHYNQSINTLPNAAAPANVLIALYNASDHLPVTALLNFSTPAGIAAYQTDQAALSIYPNPASNRLNVIRYASYGKCSIEIYDLAGHRLVEKFCADNCNELSFDLSGFSSGLYFLTLFSNTGKTTIKLIKE